MPVISEAAYFVFAAQISTSLENLMVKMKIWATLCTAETAMFFSERSKIVNNMLLFVWRDTDIV